MEAQAQQTRPSCTSESGSYLQTFTGDEATRRAWPHIKPFLHACPNHGEWTLAEVKKALTQRKAQCWLSVKDDKIEAVLVTQIKGVSWRKHCLFWIAAGENMESWLEFLPEIEVWAKSKHCNQMRIHGRRGWARVLPGYKEIYSVITRKL
jgi:hypothetical protein